jgi:hypothetical protein
MKRSSDIESDSEDTSLSSSDEDKEETRRIRRTTENISMAFV